MADKYPVILSVLTGSRAYGLWRPDSDWDIRAVHVKPTAELLSIGLADKGNRSEEIMEGDDYTSIEVGRFLQLSTASNPTILEMYMASNVYRKQVQPQSLQSSAFETELRRMFSSVWDGKKAYRAYLGYAASQRDRLFKRDTTDIRTNKLAVTWLRTLEQGTILYTYGKFPLNIQTYHTADTLRRWQHTSKALSLRDIVPIIEPAENRLREAYNNSPYKDKKPDLDRINEFLLKVRKAYWE